MAFLCRFCDRIFDEHDIEGEVRCPECKEKKGVVMTELLCRNCESWYTTQQWMGNCKKHPFEKDKYSQECTPNHKCDGIDFVDKLDKYRKQEVKA